MKTLKKPIRVLIVDDSAFMRKVINDLLESEPLITVIGHARNGKQALEMIEQEKPDIITLDIEMPILDGLKTLEIIMKKMPLPVIMLSSLTEEGSVQTISALELGAVDFIQKPTLSFMISSSQFRQDLVEMVKNAVSYHIKTPADFPEEKQDIFLIVPKARGETSDTFANKSEEITHIKQVKTKTTTTLLPAKVIVAIAVSTGGPKALQSVIPKLPADLPCAVLIVQHMPAGFTKSLAERLNQLSAIHVKEAENGEIVREGIVYIAPGNYHMRFKQELNKSTILLSQEPPVGGHRPASDELFESMAEYTGDEVICVVMTGMGSDGTKGIEKLKSKNKTYVIAQNEESCVVYGMPKSVYEAGMVDQMASLNEIAETIINRIRG